MTFTKIAEEPVLVYQKHLSFSPGVRPFYRNGLKSNQVCLCHARYQDSHAQHLHRLLLRLQTSPVFQNRTGLRVARQERGNGQMTAIGARRSLS